jgi:23S rRNA pseudouridine1911/1915/1917 synthase
MHIPIIFEDTNILVINKPSGVVVHPFDHSTEETVLDFLYEKIPESFNIGDNEKTLQDGRNLNLGGIVHKLDRDTSGVLVIAKNKESYTVIKEQFKQHTLQKKYIALVQGDVKERTFRIDGPLGRNKKEYKQMVNPTNPRGELRSAITDVEVLKTKNTLTLVSLYPRTGRTHQLRAHMAYIEHPIVGDKAYGSTITSSRIMLHAKEIAFTLFEKEYSFEAPLPDIFITMF